jgi:hypothetical protein
MDAAYLSILDENCTLICQICQGIPSLKGTEAHLAGFPANKYVARLYNTVEYA